MSQLIKKPTIFLLFTLVIVSSYAQKRELTDEQYFKNNFKGIVQQLPVFKKWTDDTHFIISINGADSLIDCKTGKSSPINNVVENKPEFPVAYIKRDDLFIKINNVETQLTNDKEKEMNPIVSPDGKYVAFTKNNDLYTVNINTNEQKRLTHDGSDVILNGYASWVYMEEILGRKSNYRSFWWSPDSKRIAFFRTDDSQLPVYTITDADGQHGLVEKQRYPKAGDPNPEVKVGIVLPAGGNIVWSDFNEKDDQYFGMPYWKPDGSSLLVQWMNRLQNNLIIYEVNPANGSKKEFYNEKQNTWVDLDDEGKRIYFLNKNKGFILMSDASGWKHMYYHSMDGKLINAITSGKFTVTDLKYVDEKNGIVYFKARSRENSARSDFYRVDINGKNLQRLTFGEFSNDINLSPNGFYFITTYSNALTPFKMALVNNKGKIIRELGNIKGEEFDSYRLAKTELVRVKSDDGLYDLPMKVTWPVNMDKHKKYPVLISIYGGPNAGRVWDVWALNGSQQWYAKEGLIQVSMDHRASGHFGKEGVNYMYHNLGYWEMKDYATMVKWLMVNANADPAKICITGFSYGGYLSCYALTYASDIFTHGMAGGSVIDWSLYDTHYTERFMGTPANNPQGYKTSSVLTHADKYKGMLQIVHGVMDDNVHLQNSVQLISKLQDLKKDFECMMYSGGRHGWGGSKGLHFQNLKTKFIYRYLLEKEVPKEALK